MREENNQLRIDNRALENLKIDLENHINSLQDRLNQVEKFGILNHPIRDTVNRWKSISKPTRDWTKANQLLEELNNLIS